MSYNLTSCTLIADQDVNVWDIYPTALEVEALEDFGVMQGHTLSDLNNTTIFLQEYLEIRDGTGYYLDPPLPDYLFDEMMLEDLYDGVDLNIYTPEGRWFDSNLYFVIMANIAGDVQYDVEYSATDSNNLTIRLTSTVIGE